MNNDSKLTKDDFDLIKIALVFYSDKILNETMELFTSQPFKFVSASDIQLFWNRKQLELNRCENLLKKLK